MRKRNFANSIALKKHRRNTFDLSYQWMGDVNLGTLTPVLCKEVIPADTFTIKDEIMVRFDPMLAPILSNVNVFVHYFFVPNRLLWDSWEDFITGGPDGTLAPVPPAFQPSVEGLCPHGTTGDYDFDTMLGPNSLADYLGVEPLSSSTFAQQDERNPIISLLPFKAYQKIYNDYYRDQNFTSEVDLQTSDSGVCSDNTDDEINPELFSLRQRCWEKDYFTSALPWTQRGVQMSIPFPVDVPVSGVLNLYPYDDQGEAIAKRGALNNNAANVRAMQDAGSGSTLDSFLYWRDSQDSQIKAFYASPFENSDSPLAASGTNEGAPTINDLRAAMRIQEWLERNAVGGSRYIEQIYAHFGVKSSDARLQRAEYLGGGRVPCVVSEVQQTSETGTTPLGELGGHGLAVGQSIKFKSFFEEHGFVIGILSIMPRSMYCNGINRMFLRRDKFDYFWPNFAHLGEQAIYNCEVKANQTINDSFGEWGYQSRYAEYKFSPGEVHGTLRTNRSYWHFGRNFATLPNLNEAFVKLGTLESANLESRVFPNGNDSNPFTVLIFHNFLAKRQMPRFGTPML